MAKKEQKKVVKVVSPRGVVAYGYIHRPDSGGQFSDNKYKLDLVCDPDAPELKEIEKKCKQAAKEKWGKVPADLKLPFIDGDEREQEEFHGKVILRPKSKFMPTVVDAKRQELPEGVKVFSGDVVKFSAVLYPYEKPETVIEKVNGKKVKRKETIYGVSLQLRGVQLLEKRAVSSYGDAADDFEDEDGFDAAEGYRSDDDDSFDEDEGGDGDGDDEDDF